MNKCIISIIKDEHNYLEQWIAYHISLGIDTLYLYEDIGSESHAYITDKYEQVHLMSVLDVYYNDTDKEFALQRRLNNKPMQIQFLQMAYKRLRDKYDWLFLIDVDEYITCDEPLEEVLKKFDDYDALVMQWQNYNANGHYRKPSPPYNLIETYTEKCSPCEFDEKRKVTTKTAYNGNKYIRYLLSQHKPDPNSNWCYSNFTKDTANKTYNSIYIRHYITKSYEEYLHKLYVRGMCHKGHRSDQEFFEYNPNMTDKQKIKEVKDLYDLYE